MVYLNIFLFWICCLNATSQANDILIKLEVSSPEITKLKFEDKISLALETPEHQFNFFVNDRWFHFYTFYEHPSISKSKFVSEDIFSKMELKDLAWLKNQDENYIIKKVQAGEVKFLEEIKVNKTSKFILYEVDEIEVYQILGKLYRIFNPKTNKWVEAFNLSFIEKRKDFKYKLMRNDTLMKYSPIYDKFSVISCKPAGSKQEKIYDIVNDNLNDNQIIFYHRFIYLPYVGKIAYKDVSWWKVDTINNRPANETINLIEAIE